ncbi:ATP-binding protein, partial [Halobacterium salinarum]|nr:ATP-binding protein [Halobacterium salinarum]
MDVHFATVRSTNSSEGTLDVLIDGQAVTIEDNTEGDRSVGDLVEVWIDKGGRVAVEEVGRASPSVGVIREAIG